MVSTLYSRAFSVLGVEFGIISNTSSGIADEEYFCGTTHLHSLLSNFRHLVSIPYTGNHHASIIITDDDRLPFSLTTEGDTMYVSGPITQLEQSTADKRSSIFGNMGIVSKFMIAVMERHGIYSFHSTSFYDPATKRLFLVLGESGAGKSTVLLAALEKNLEVFGTELTHVSIQQDKTVFHKGSLIQNCRVGNLVEDFPELQAPLHITGLPTTNVWHSYLSVDLTERAFPQEELIDPAVTVLFPKIESDRKVPEQFQMGTKRLDEKIFRNLCEKTGAATYAYGKHFCPALDTPQAETRRAAFALEFTRTTRIDAVWKTLANPHMCLQQIV